MRKDFYIFRHGETDLNQQKRWQGSGMDYNLNETGIAQAKSLADKLSGKGLQIIYSSPLRRARHTAEIAARQLNIPLEIEENLKECYYGNAEGKPIAELEKECPEILLNWTNPDEKYKNICFPGGESKQKALERVLSVIIRLSEKPYACMGVAIHGGTMAQLLNYYKVPFKTIPNCGVFHLIYDGSRFFVDGSVF